MKVNYKETLVEKIRNVADTAIADGKEIRSIELNPKETKELKKIYGSYINIPFKDMVLKDIPAGARAQLAGVYLILDVEGV